jgi:hypothetical protein
MLKLLPLRQSIKKILFLILFYNRDASSSMVWVNDGFIEDRLDVDVSLGSRTVIALAVITVFDFKYDVPIFTLTVEFVRERVSPFSKPF